MERDSQQEVLKQTRLTMRARDISNRLAEEKDMIIKRKTAYNLAKGKRGTEVYPIRIPNHTEGGTNGLSVSLTYSYDMACAQFLDVTPDKPWEKTRDNFFTPYPSIIIDVDADISTRERELIEIIWNELRIKTALMYFRIKAFIDLSLPSSSLYPGQRVKYSLCILHAKSSPSSQTIGVTKRSSHYHKKYGSQTQTWWQAV